VIAVLAVVGLLVIRFIRNLTFVEWLVIGIVPVILGNLAVDAVDAIHAHMANQQGAAEAQRDIAAGDFNFRIGGRPPSWFDETATVFRDRYGANLVRTFRCCSSRADRSYDSAYNDTMVATIAQRIASFSFGDAYDAANNEGRKRMENRLGGP